MSKMIERLKIFEDINKFINHDFEKDTNSILYNKKEILDIIKKEDIKDSSKIMELLCDNYIPYISFENMFKSDLGFNLLFHEDKVIILYKNERINLDNLDNIKSELIDKYADTDNLITVIPRMNIMNVIKKFIEKDLSVKYICKDIPIAYWQLFKIKCNKSNTIDNSQYYETIINGTKYKTIENKEKISKKDIENDQIYRMEIMNYIEEEDMDKFFGYLEYLDQTPITFDAEKINTTYSMIYIRTILSFIRENNNTILNYYLYNRILKFIISLQNNNIDVTIDVTLLKDIFNLIKLILENNDIQAFGLQVCNDLVCNIAIYSDFIDKL